VSSGSTDSDGPAPERAFTIRNVTMALLGGATLVVVPAYDGSLADVVAA